MHENARKRFSLLQILYAAREARPDNGWVRESDLKDAVGKADFHLAVLEEIGQVKRDGYRWAITGAGIFAFEQSEVAA
jgi:NOL1/NOP2/fmu family ribosome biogenesis protein